MRVLPRFAALIATLAAVAGCGNDAERAEVGKTYIDALKSGAFFGRETPVPQPTLDQLAVVVSKTVTDPVILVEMKDGGGTAAIVEIERNGSYITYATGDRRTITMKGGMATATRGLGQDLMSSASGESADMVRARRTGEVTRVMRHIEGDDQTRKRRFACQITRGTKDDFAGDLHSSGTIMVERCRAEDLDFTNAYVVSGSGRITESIQWLSPLRGYAQFLPMNM